MIKFTTVFSLTLLLVALTSCGQTSNPFHNGAYLVDNNIKQQVDKKVKSLNGVTMSSMDFKMFVNDSLIGQGNSIFLPLVFFQKEARRRCVLRAD